MGNVVYGFAIPFQFLTVKITANSKNGAHTETILHFYRNDIQTHIFWKLISHMFWPCEISKHLAHRRVNLHTLTNSGHYISTKTEFSELNLKVSRWSQKKRKIWPLNQIELN